CAFAMWKAGERKAAVREFALIIDTFTTPPRAEEDWKAYLLYRRVGHAIARMDGAQCLAELWSGCFTDQSVGEEVRSQLSKLPDPTLAHLWFILASLEYKLALGDMMFRRFEEELLKEPKPEIMLVYFSLRLKHSLRSSQADRLIADYLKW